MSKQNIALITGVTGQYGSYLTSLTTMTSMRFLWAPQPSMAITCGSTSLKPN